MVSEVQVFEFKRVRKKPVEVEAIKAHVLINLSANNFWGLPKVIIDAYDEGKIIFCPKEIHIQTLEGTMTADYNDWIIRGINGEFYPCKPDIFLKTYDII